MAMSSEQKSDEKHIVAAEHSRRAASWFALGNLVSMLVPVPLGIFWFGASMIIYAINRHHPNPRVGYYTQRGAYFFYGVTGLIVVVATFFGTNLTYWMITWAVSALLLIPVSIMDLIKIKRETWQDVPVEEL